MKFGERYDEWCEFVKVVGELDALICLCLGRESLGICCRPTFCEGKIFNVKGLRHACVEERDFIANDTLLCEEERMILLTGKWLH